jgi:hypothetical protein
MIFKNKTNQPEITTNNANLYLGGMYGLGNYSMLRDKYNAPPLEPYSLTV